MYRWRRLFLISSIITCYLLEAQGASKDTDENRPYEFGFTIDGEQHRHEEKDKNGIIMGEFGFITADGVYHVTVYATDENGGFKILSMKNIRVKPYPTAPTRQGHSLQFPPSPQQTSAPSSPDKELKPNNKFEPVSLEPPTKSCSHCSIPTTSTKPPPPLPPPNSVQPTSNNYNNGFLGNTGTNNQYPQNNGIQQHYPNSPQNNNFPASYPQQPSLIDNNQNNYGNPTYPQTQSRQTNSQRNNLNSAQNSPPPASAQNYPGQSNVNGAQNYPQGLSNPPQDSNAQQSNPQPESFSQRYPPGSAPPQSSYPPQNNLQPGSFKQENNNQYPTQNGNIPASSPSGERMAKQFNPQEPFYPQGNNQDSSNSPQYPQPPSKPTLISAQMQIVDKNTDIYHKKPGEKEGLPDGLTKHDMMTLLYTFNYTVGFHGHFEEGYTNGVKQGYYFVTGRNGVRTRVDYTADDKGFHPKISQEVLDLLSDDVPKPETEKDAKYGLKGYEFKWLYYPVEDKTRR